MDKEVMKVKISWIFERHINDQEDLTVVRWGDMKQEIMEVIDGIIRCECGKIIKEEPNKTIGICEECR